MPDDLADRHIDPMGADRDQPEEPKPLTGTVAVLVEASKVVHLRECHGITDRDSVVAWAREEALRQLRAANWDVEHNDVIIADIELDEQEPGDN